MRTAEEIQVEIDELNRKLSIVSGGIEKKEAELSGLLRSHVELISKNAGMKQPKSISAARAGIALLEQELCDGELAQSSLLESLRCENEQLELATMQHQQVADYSDALQVSDSLFSSIWTDIDALKALLMGLEAKVKALQQAKNPTMVLELLLKELQRRNLSYRAFLEAGEIKPADFTDNNNYLDELRSVFRKPLDLIRDLVLPSFNEIGSSLISILAWSDGSNLTDFRHREQPPETRYNPVSANPNTVEHINPLVRNPDYWKNQQVEKDKKMAELRRQSQQ
jgi:hypothetical protein